MATDESTRDRVRALVRNVLENALPAEDETAGGATPVNPQASSAPTVTASSTPSRFINTVPEQVGGASKEAAIARDESSKMVITETDVHGLEEGARLRIAEGARLTPLAADIVRERKIELVRRPSRRGSSQSKLVAVGADHGGYAMKEELKTFLAELGHRVRDYGTNSEAAVDYPDFAHGVARAVADTQADVGIIIDGAGVGSCMTANKVPGVRAAACYTVALARNSREHNDANVLGIGARVIAPAYAREVVRLWLETPFDGGRHERRIEQIVMIERGEL